MRVSSYVLDTIGIIGLPCERRGVDTSIHWGGTCFFVEETASASPPKIWGYMVTARHVAEAVADRDFFLRLNLKAGGSVIIQSPGQSCRWWVHPTDESADVAVVRWLPPEGTLSLKRWNVADFVTARDISEGRFGPGDDIDMFGLFSPMPGEDQNLTILRKGTLSMLPNELVRTKRGPTEAYLVEARSIGGLSGSPVVVTETMAHTVGSARMKGIGKSALLGLVHGHWEFSESGESAEDPKSFTSDSGHSGVTIVVPAQKILDVINQEEIVELKRAELPELLKGE